MTAEGESDMSSNVINNQPNLEIFSEVVVFALRGGRGPETTAKGNLSLSMKRKFYYIAAVLVTNHKEERVFHKSQQ